MMGVMRTAVLLVLLAACGDDGVRHTPDASPHDGPSIDAPDAAAQPVTVTVTRDGQAVPNVHVYFQNADSSVVLATTTDANGAASAVMDAGGSVTAVDPYALPLFGVSQSNDIETILGVKPGDHLQLAMSNTQTGITVNVDAAIDPAATSEKVFSPCASDGVQVFPPPQTAVAAPVAVTLTNCGATTDFLLVSYDETGAALNTAYFPAIAVADQGTVDLSTATFAGVDTKTWTFDNVPAQTSLSVADALIGPRGVVFQTFLETPSDSTNPTVTMAVPTFTGANQLVQTSLYTGNQHTLLDWGPYASTFTTDVGARFLAEFSGAPSFDPATHTASITEAATGATADFSMFFMSANRAADQHQWYWTVVAPHATAIALPTLPTDIYDFNITAADTASVDGWVAGAVPGGYDAIRPLLLSTTGPSDLAALAGTGSAAVVQYQPPLARTRVRFRSRDTMAGHAQALPARLSRRVR